MKDSRFIHLLIVLVYSGIYLGIYFLLEPLFNLEEPARSDTQLLLARLWFLTGLIHFISTLVLKKTEVKTSVKHFFLSPESSLNLGIFRIIYFAWVGYGLLAIFIALGVIPLSESEFAFEKFIWTDLDKSSIVSLPFMDWYIMNVPINEQWVKAATYLLLASGFLAMIGLFTRFSALINAIAIFYLIGIPNFFGKVNHSHFMVWFPLILALSPCGDRLSLDALIRRRRRPGQALQYGLPLKLIWVLMGVMYFFPGFWKLWNGGLDWIFKGNLLHQMQFRWIELQGWRPFIRIDQFPVLVNLGALLVIIWELGFIIMIFKPMTRKIAAVEGVFFHLSTLLFMNIGFTKLVICYASFVNWEWLLKKLSIKAKVESLSTYAPSVRSIVPISVVGALLIVMNLGAGIFHIVSWPFACFPTFEAIVGTRTQVLQYYSKDINGEKQQLSKDKIIELMRPERYRALEHRIIMTYPQDTQKYRQTLNTLADIWYKEFSEDWSDSLVIYLDKIPIAPDSTAVVLQREHLATFAKKDLLSNKSGY